jgi:hypothetical protein
VPRMGPVPSRPRLGLRTARLLVPLVLGRADRRFGFIFSTTTAFAVLTISAKTALAQSWRTYANARFGTVAQVPVIGALASNKTLSAVRYLLRSAP